MLIETFLYNLLSNKLVFNYILKISKLILNILFLLYSNKYLPTGKMCMGLVDIDRNSAAEDRGYKTTLNTMVPLECTPKNNMIVGKSSR